jgi:hypothetical protein
MTRVKKQKIAKEPVKENVGEPVKEIVLESAEEAPKGEAVAETAVAEIPKETPAEPVKEAVKKIPKGSKKGKGKKHAKEKAKETPKEPVKEKEVPKEDMKGKVKEAVTEAVGAVKSGALNMNKKMLIGAAVILVILAGVSRFAGGKLPTISLSKQKASSSESAPSAASVGNNSVTIGDQPAGGSVSISSVSVEKKGFAIVHGKDGDMLGKIIGASELLPPGEAKNLQITLREPTEAGKDYLIVLVVDNGDGRYMPGADRPVMSADGVGGALKTPFSVK